MPWCCSGRRCNSKSHGAVKYPTQFYEIEMAQSQKPRKPYKPREIRAPMIVGTDLVLRPLEAIIDQIERDGTVNTSGKGVPMFQAGDGKWYDTADAIDGVIVHFEMYAMRHTIDLPLDALRELHVALKYQVPVFERTMTGLRHALPVLRRALALSDPDDAVDILTQAQIKFELEAA